MKNNSPKLVAGLGLGLSPIIALALFLWAMFMPPAEPTTWNMPQVLIILFVTIVAGIAIYIFGSEKDHRPNSQSTFSG